MAKLYLQRVSPNALAPTQATTFSACFDLYADLTEREVTVFGSDNSKRIVDTMLDELVLGSGERALVPTGWLMQPQEGFAIKFYPRSGCAIKQGLNLANSVGIIDRDFPNETMLAIQNTSSTEVILSHGERLGQLEVYAVEPIDMDIVFELPKLTSNRTGGFGHTGV